MSGEIGTAGGRCFSLVIGRVVWMSWNSILLLNIPFAGVCMILIGLVVDELGNE